MCSFFTCDSRTAKVPPPDRRARRLLREGTDDVADPVFYLKKTRKDELIPPKVRETQSRIPKITIPAGLGVVNRNYCKNNAFRESLTKASPSV